MSLYGALFSGVSGLAAQSSSMGAISDNISNVNTVGYKGTTVNFQTLVTQQVATTEYSPGGVQSKPRAGIDVQGLLQATNSSTDVALSGQGFFVVNASAQPGIEGGSFGYTRAGSFKPDKNGYLQNAAGFYLQGWPLTPTDNSVAAVPSQETINGTTYMKAYKNPDGTFHYVNQNVINTTEMQSFNVDTIGGTAEATSSITMGANLPSGDPIYDPKNPANGGIHTTNVLVYDSLGNTGNAQFTWTKTGANAWQLGATPPAGAATATLANTAPDGTQTVYASQGQLELQSVPPLGSYLTLSGLVGGAATPSYVRVQFYNSSSTGTNNVDPTRDGPNVAGSATSPYIIGIDLNGVTSTAGVATAIQNALQTAANQPGKRNTFYSAQVLQGGTADGGSRFQAQGNVLRIIQEPGAAAVNVNCISNATTGLGSSILESGAGVGSGAPTSGTNPTAGQFTVQAIANTYSQTASTQQTNSFTVSQVTAPAATIAGSNTFTVNNTTAAGSLTIGATTVTWATLKAGGGAYPYTNASTTQQLAANANYWINNVAAVAGVTSTVAGANVTISSTNTTNTTVTADSTAGEATWVNGTDGSTAEAVPPGNYMQIGNIQIPYQQIITGKITDIYNAQTGVMSNAAPLPITLPHGASGTDTAAITSTSASNTTFMANNIASAITQLAAGGVNLGGVSATPDATNTNQVDLTSGSTPASIFINNGDSTWANGTIANVNPVVMGQVGQYKSGTAGSAITFNGDGTPASIIPNTMQFVWANGAENQTGSVGSATQKPEVSLNFGHLNQADGITQLGGTYQLNQLNQNGAKFGNFSGVTIGSDGVVTALFDNGVRTPVFQIPIATFNNPDGMQSLSGNVFIDTSTSGAYTLRPPGQAGSGTVAEASLEASTVDLGTEFTSMITVQNAYSAAAKIISTTSQMLNTLIQINIQ